MTQGGTRTTGKSGFDPYQKRLFAFLSVATFFEGYDFFAISQVLPHLRAEFELDHASASRLLGFVNVGTVLAYLLIGKADRIGRKRLLSITIVGYAIFTAMSGLAPNVYVFAACQLLARIFLIGEWATSMVVAAEEFPAARRGFVLGVVGAMAGLGSVLCVAVVPFLTSSFGWRSVYFAGVLPLFLLAYARRGLRETRRFTQLQEQGTNSGKLLILVRSHFFPLALKLGLIWFVTYIATQNAVSVWKDYAMTELLMSEKAAGATMTIAALVAMPVAFLAGPLIDRLGRRIGATFILMSTAIGVLGAYLLPPGAALTICLTLTVIGVSAVLTVLNAFTTELFPTELRGSAFALTNNLIGRTGYWLSPFMIGEIARETGWGPPLRWTALFPVLALVLIWLWLPETRGRELEEIAESAVDQPPCESAP